MINASTEFWDFERASYDDELDAWRERTAFVPPASPAAVAEHRIPPVARRPSAERRSVVPTGRPARIRIQRTARRRLARSRG
jgi:hypothetical protein